MVQLLATMLLLSVSPLSAQETFAGIDASPEEPLPEYSPSGARMSLHFSRPLFSREANGLIPEVSGLPLRSVPGEPLVPFRRIFIPIPEGVEPQVGLEEVRTSSLERAPGRLAITPELRGTGLETREDYDIQRLSGPAARLEYRTMHLGGSRVMVIDIYPYLPSSPSVYVAEADLRVSWPSTPGWERLQQGPLAGLCPHSPPWWPGERGKAESPFWGRPWARLEIDKSGVYCVTGSELEDSGCPVTGSPSASLRMLTGPGTEFDIFNRTQEQLPLDVALDVRDGGDGIFDRSDSLLFYAQSLSRFALGDSGQSALLEPLLPHLTHVFDDRNVYWLTWGGESGTAMEGVDATPDGSQSFGSSALEHLWMEADLTFEEYGGWLWYRLYPGLPISLYPEVSQVAGPAEMDLSFQIIEDRADVDVTIGTDTLFSGILPLSGQLELDSVSLAGMPVVTVRPRTGEYEDYLDYVYVRYPRMLSEVGGRLLTPRPDQSGRYSLSLGLASQPTVVLDISDPLKPLSLEGGVWSGGSLSLSHDLDGFSAMIACAPADLLEPASTQPAQPGRLVGSLEPVDVMLIAGDALFEAAEPLLAIYESRGRTCQLVNLEEVADEFGMGVYHPGAVRSFIRFMLDEWADPVDEVVFIGDGHFDPLHRISSSPCPFPIWYYNQYENRLVCKDDFFALCHQDQQLPEVALSRIPAGDVSELGGYLAKLAARDLSSSAGPWAVRDLLIADDEWGYGANESVHTQQCDALADTMEGRYRREKFYLIEYPWPQGTDPEQGTHPEKPEAREDLVALMSQGWRTAWYFGHGSHGQLAGEKLLLSSDAVRASSGPMSPVLLTFCCNSGDFFLTAADCLAEAFAMSPGGGSIASISPVGGTFSNANTPLSQSIAIKLEELPDAGIGLAFWQAKLEVATPIQQGYLDPTGNSETCQYHCLGDGGVVPARPPDLPGGLSLEGDTLYRGRTASVEFGAGAASLVAARITESDAIVEHTMLGGEVLTYQRQGDAFYQGSLYGAGGPVALDVFVPVQADTGLYSRCGAVALQGQPPLTAQALEWLPLLDAGGYRPDSTPPAVELWLDGRRGESDPEVWGDLVARAHLEDSSGICILGGAAGRTLLLSVDGQGFDVGDYFAYRQGSSTEGDLEFALPSLSQGEHRLILAAWDGMANGVQDTLDFKVVQAPSDLLRQVVVYPNPGDGLRVFSYQASSSGSVEATIYTAAGRAIWHGRGSCVQGYNQLMWNGRDDDGDLPACGTYIYRLRVESQERGSAERVGRIVVIR